MKKMYETHKLHVRTTVKPTHFSFQMDVQTLKVCMLFFLRYKDIFGDWIPTVCNNEHLMDGREKKNQL